MRALQSPPNIGLKLEQQLAAAGVKTFEEQNRAGSREAWLRIKAADPAACYMRLCAPEGAVRGIGRHDLDDAVRSELKFFYV